MSKVFLASVIAGILCISGVQCGSAKVQNPQSKTTKEETGAKRTSLLLTNQQPIGSFPVEIIAASRGSEIMELTVSKVVNPSMTPINIVVHLSPTEGKTDSDSQHQIIGNFSLYPADRPGKFLLPASAIWRQLSTQSKGQKLVIELERVDKAKPWTTVEVELEQPVFRAGEKNPGSAH